MKNWIENAVFYHIYPLGFCGANRYHEEEITHSIQKIIAWIPHLKELNVNALYLGPVFESYEHGYDTSDYQTIDHRLGSNDDFKKVCEALHVAGIHIVLDGVFNHVGRSFWAFEDVLKNRENSAYKDWFSNLRFDCDNPMHDGFCYDTWQGYHNLVKLNLKNDAVIHYLLESVGMWMDEFQIDGLRLDAADCVDRDFFRQLKTFCKKKDENFWLMGEIIHGDYNVWVNDTMLDSVTNYECYKGLYSSHNDKNYFEIAHSLQRQFGNGGIYEHLHLYNFVDNHDVNRLCSTLKDKHDLENIYTLLFTIPGIPSIYYGSEWALEGEKHDGSDADIRPTIDLDSMKNAKINEHIAKLGAIRNQHSMLFDGAYLPVVLQNEQFIFMRTNDDETIYIACNVSDAPCEESFSCSSTLIDLLTGKVYPSQEHTISITMELKSSYILLAQTSDSTRINNEKEESKKDPICEETPLSLQPVIEELPMGRYEHFKGKHYAVLYVATHSETLEKYVVYRQLYGNEDIWVRPFSMFQESVEVDGKWVPRFRYLGR